MERSATLRSAGVCISFSVRRKGARGATWVQLTDYDGDAIIGLQGNGIGGLSRHDEWYLK